MKKWVNNVNAKFGLSDLHFMRYIHKNLDFLGWIYPMGWADIAHHQNRSKFSKNLIMSNVDRIESHCAHLPDLASSEN